MMKCVQVYLKEGLIKLESALPARAALIEQTALEFVEFMEWMNPIGQWMDKREFEDLFKGSYPAYSEGSPHRFTKWLGAFAESKGAGLEMKSTGGDYLFKLQFGKENG
jgi:hypothetical protein